MEGKTETYYEILGIPKGASDREIKEAYRCLARRLHPDVCGEDDAEDRFKALNEAYRVLSDHGERARYDTLGHENYRLFRPGLGDRHAARGPHHGFPGFGDAFDLFSPGRNWGSPRSFRPKAASDILAGVQVTLEEAVLGAEKEVEVPCAFRCPACRGTGSASGRPAGPCARCAGTGREGTMPGRIPPPGSALCRECGGRGRVPGDPCGRCDGWGAIQETRRVPFRIPPGIENGMRIRMEGLGNRSDADIPGGDLYIEVTVLPHERFTRSGHDLVTLLHLSPARAALGAVVEVLTIRGKTVRADVPPGVQHDAAVRVTGEGVKERDRCGDLILRIRIDIPEQITAEEQDLYRRILRVEKRREGPRRGLLGRCISRIRDRGT